MSQNIHTMDEDLAIHQQMDDEPNDAGGLSAQELKAAFDYAALALQKYINEVLTPAHNRLGGDVDNLARELRNHVNVDPGNITAQNVGLLRELADKYGLTDKLAPTVHDALEVLEPLVGPRDQLVKLAPAHIYMEHWWQRRKAAQTFAPSVGDEISLVYSDDRNSKNCIAYAGSSISAEGYTIQYSDAVAHDTEGDVVLVNPAEATVFLRDQDGNDTDPETWAFLRGKYVCNNYGRFLYIPADAVFVVRTHPDPYYMYAKTVCLVTPNVPPRVWESLRSEDRNAFPDSGVEGEWEYLYVGVPMDNVAQARGAERGSYVGTGVCGEAHPNVLDFPFVPSMVIVCEAAVRTENFLLFLNTPLGGVHVRTDDDYYTDNAFYAAGGPVFAGTSVSWYSSTERAQANELGKEYCYVAFR